MVEHFVRAEKGKGKGKGRGGKKTKKTKTKWMVFTRRPVEIIKSILLFAIVYDIIWYCFINCKLLLWIRIISNGSYGVQITNFGRMEECRRDNIGVFVIVIVVE